jgi:hypothetical protein
MKELRSNSPMPFYVGSVQAKTHLPKKIGEIASQKIINGASANAEDET